MKTADAMQKICPIMTKYDTVVYCYTIDCAVWEQWSTSVYNESEHRTTHIPDPNNGVCGLITKELNTF